MRVAILMVGVLLVAACGGGGGSSNPGGVPTPPPPTTTAGLARTTCGDYQGVDRGNTWSFLGLRYAAPPTGPRRWKSPELPTCPSASSSPTIANTYAPVCPQLDRASGAPEGDEDCLAVNVFTPKSAFAGARAPVMFFIHGGGNVIGSAREELEPGRVLYDGSSLAEATGNVVVTVQYRLGPLGWLVHPGLDAEAPDARSGNYGLEDLVAALKWVQRDIGAFGGNKDRVMIFGESAGGVNVCALLASPQATGLFHAALMESGGCVADSRAKALGTGATLAENSGCSTSGDVVACLRSRTPAALLAALPPTVSVSGGQAPYQPSVDGTTLPAVPIDRIRSGQHNRVSVTLGTNADETGQDVPLAFSDAQYQAFLDSTFQTPAVRAAVADLYSATNFGSSRKAYVALTSDLKFTCPARTTARALAAAQSEPVYRYFFTEVVDAPTSAVYGAFHGLELLFIYGTLDVRGYTPTTSERALSLAMQRYWGGFAATGTPVASGSSAWALYDPARDNHLLLDSAAVRMADGVNTARCDFWAQLGL